MITNTSLFFGRPDTLSVQISHFVLITAFYRCRGIKVNKNVDKQQDRVFLCPMFSVDKCISLSHKDKKSLCPQAVTGFRHTKKCRDARPCVSTGCGERGIVYSKILFCNILIFNNLTFQKTAKSAHFLARIWRRTNSRNKVVDRTLRRFRDATKRLYC